MGLGTPTRDPALMLVTVCVSWPVAHAENQPCEEMVVSEGHCGHVIVCVQITTSHTFSTYIFI